MRVAALFYYKLQSLGVKMGYFYIKKSLFYYFFW